MLRRRDGGPSPPPGAPLWMTTYGGLVTQLLAMFVLLFAFSAFGGQFRASPTGAPGPANPDLARIRRQVEQALGEKGFLSQVEIQLEEDRLLVRFSDQVLFDSGQATLRPEALPRLDALAEVLKAIPNRVKVEGHTDSDPIATPQFPSNWELSTARAATVVRYFVEWHGLDPRRFEASGMGEWHPVAPNDTPEHKQRNRRVDILILSDKVR